MSPEAKKVKRAYRKATETGLNPISLKYAARDIADRDPDHDGAIYADWLENKRRPGHRPRTRPGGHLSPTKPRKRHAYEQAGQGYSMDEAKS